MAVIKQITIPSGRTYDIAARYDVNGDIVLNDKKGVLTASNNECLSLIDRVLIEGSYENRIYFLPQSYVTYETSTDGGTTWSELSVSSAIHNCLFGGDSLTYKLSIPFTQSLRITMAINGYVFVDRLMMYLSGGEGRFTLLVEKQKWDSTEWETIGSATNFDIGWPGYNVLYTDNIRWRNVTYYKCYRYIRITIIPTTLPSSLSYDYAVYKIQYYGTYQFLPKRAYAVDYNKNSTFIGAVRATSFVKLSGTSSQFLKADGSVDSNTYLTSHQDISGKENTSNKVTTIDDASTDTQYPSAKCVYEVIRNKYAADASIVENWDGTSSETSLEFTASTGVGSLVYASLIGVTATYHFECMDMGTMSYNDHYVILENNLTPSTQLNVSFDANSFPDAVTLLSEYGDGTTKPMLTINQGQRVKIHIQWDGMLCVMTATYF